MKTFLLWILFVSLIWVSKADDSEDTNKNGKAGKTGLFWSKMENSSKVLTARPPETPIKRSKRYTTNMPWTKDQFTYSVLKYTSDMPARVQERVFEKAFDMWHKAAPQLKFEFKRNDPNVDFKISFVRGAHGDSQSFDGTGPLLAHVYYPEDGRMHFDDDEWFTDKSKYGVNLLSIAVHEIGHGLGLGHSGYPKSSVMYKKYQKYKGKDKQLDPDDIKGIRKLYRIHPSDRGNPKCKDKNMRLCLMHKEEGYCKYKQLMKKYCPFTCGLCHS